MRVAINLGLEWTQSRLAHVDLRTNLLQETIAFAAEKTAYYSYLRGKEIRSIDDLGSLPFVSKIDLSFHGVDMLSTRPPFDSLRISSGTTWSDFQGTAISPQSFLLEKQVQPTFVFRPPEENALANHIFGLGEQSGEFVLRIENGTHGGASTVLENVRSISLPLQKPFHYAAIQKLIQDAERFFGEPITTLVAPSNQLKNLVALQQICEKPLFSENVLRCVVGYGSFVTSKWRESIETSFQNVLTDVFGVSEIFGSGSSKCPLCNGFHVQPWVIPEIINPFTGNLTNAQNGELVLTCLLPFSRLQPLIRYRTGDIVQVGSCSIDLSFRPVGKVSRSFFNRDGQLLLGDNEIIDVLDGFQQLSRWHTPAHKALLIPSMYGPPKYRCKDAGRPLIDQTDICIEISKSNVAVKEVDESTVEVISQIRERLQELVRAPEYRIEILSIGTSHEVDETSMPKW